MTQDVDMDMEAISNQLLYRYSTDRSEQNAEQSSRKLQSIDGHHPGRRVGHAHRHEQAHGIDQRRAVDDRDDDRRHAKEYTGESESLSYRRSERTALHIQTQEGDMVRLKIKASESLSVAAGQVEDDGETISELELQARSRTRISFKVKGELNEEEMAAIQSVIDQAGAMAENFFTGNAEGAFATASALEIDAAQLAKVRIRMKSSEQLTYPLAGILPAQQSGGPQVAATEPVADEPVDTADNPVAPAGEVAAGGDSEAAAAVPVPAERATDVATEETAPVSFMANSLQSIGVFLNNLMDTFGGDDQAQGGQASGDSMTLKLQVFRSLLLSVSELQNPAQEDPATALAADTLDAMTVQQAPLEAVA